VGDAEKVVLDSVDLGEVRPEVEVESGLVLWSEEVLSACLGEGGRDASVISGCRGRGVRVKGQDVVIRDNRECCVEDVRREGYGCV
jgi:hypothetical protein